VCCCSKYQKRKEIELSARARNLLYIVVDLSPVTDIDASAVHFLMVSLLASVCATPVAVNNINLYSAAALKDLLS